MLSAIAVPWGGDSTRSALRGGLAFLEGSSTPGWGIGGLRDWFQVHVVEPGCMATPIMVSEPTAGVVVLHGGGDHRLTLMSNLPRILGTARSRVVSALRGLIASPVDDRFLSGAIFAGRVSRRRVQGANEWVAQPESTAPLSGIVLGLFAVDVLSNRELYDRLFCMCDVCDRITFQEGAQRRKSCPDHPTPGSVSGVVLKARPQQHDGTKLSSR